jgi:hypothetical protein
MFVVASGNNQSPEQLDGLNPSERTHENEEPNDCAAARSVVVLVERNKHSLFSRDCGYLHATVQYYSSTVP